MSEFIVRIDIRAAVSGSKPTTSNMTEQVFKAWDCDANKGIPPESEPVVFEEIATMEFPFEGIPTVPPRKDMSHMVRCVLRGHSS